MAHGLDIGAATKINSRYDSIDNGPIYSLPLFKVFLRMFSKIWNHTRKETNSQPHVILTVI